MANYQKSELFHLSPDGTTDGGPGEALDGYVAAGSFDSAPLNVMYVDKYLIVVSCPATGSPSGTLTVQECIDYSAHELYMQPDPQLANWVTVALTDETTGNIVTSKTISGATTVALKQKDCGGRWLRLVYTAISGTITITAKIQFKGIKPGSS